jgi:hypothetical protein
MAKFIIDEQFVSKRFLGKLIEYTNKTTIDNDI